MQEIDKDKIKLYDLWCGEKITKQLIPLYSGGRANRLEISIFKLPYHYATAPLYPSSGYQKGPSL